MLLFVIGLVVGINVGCCVAALSRFSGQQQEAPLELPEPTTTSQL